MSRTIDLFRIIMHLLEIPVEVLAHIFRQLPCVELRSTLTTSRSWYATANNVCYEDVVLDYTTCDTSVNAQARGMQKISIIAMKSLTLVLPPAIADEGESPVIGALRILPTTIKEAKSLTDFTLRSILVEEPDADKPSLALWRYPEFAGCVNVLLLAVGDHEGLQCVDIDLVRPFRYGGFTGWPLDVHLCPAFARILARVPRSRLHFPNLCEAIFEHSSTDDMPRRSRDIVINMRHHLDTPEYLSTATTYDCAEGKYDNQLMSRMVLRPLRVKEAARRVLPDSPRLNRLRVVWQQRKSSDVFAEDLVSGRFAKIQGDDVEEWGEEVENVEDDWFYKAGKLVLLA